MQKLSRKYKEERMKIVMLDRNSVGMDMDVSIHFNIDSTGANTLCFIFHNMSSFLLFNKGSIAEKGNTY